MFATLYTDILHQVENINPIEYGRTRNYLNGAVTKLSPYISRGVISTKQIAASVLAKGYAPTEIEAFLKELAWRDYFQQVWIALGDNIHSDIKQPQQYKHQLIPKKLVEASTGISAIDYGIQQLYETGYMHNHMRMYVASIACNIARSHWLLPAKWMYYHLLDADWASNALSWQWVAGTFSHKKYYANQENINRFSGTHQTHTLLDTSYETLMSTDLSDEFAETMPLPLTTHLPKTLPCKLNATLPTYVYHFYNLDPIWGGEINANRVLLLEPSFFQKYPVSESTIGFVLKLAQNIPNIQIHVGEFADLLQEADGSPIHYKEHPTNAHYRGITHYRDWMFEEVKGYYPSFFSYWKKAVKHLPKLVTSSNL